MVIVFVVALLSIYGFTKINAKTIRFFLVSIALIAVFYAYLFSIKLDRNAAGVESFLYKVKIAPSEVFSTKINRENHKDLWDHWRGYEVKRAFALMNESKSSYVIGTGFGSLIDLKFKAPLDLKGIRYISETHNGYIYIFYKTGIVGLLLLLYFLKKLHGYVYREYTFVNQFIGLTGMVFFFTTLTITGIYNPKDVIIIILGGLIAVSHNNNATRSTLK
jgi:O-antigen ligase